MTGDSMSEQQRSLDDLFDELTEPDDAPSPAPQQREEVEQPAPEATGEKQEAAPPPGTVDELGDNAPDWARKAVTDERRKRQELEREAKELREKLERISRQSQPQQQEQQEPPDFYSDPDGFVRNIQQQFQTGLYATKVTLSQEMMRSLHQDYDEVEQVFAEAAQNDPVLQRQLIMSDNPARFAYETGKRLKQFQAMQADPDRWQRFLAWEAGQQQQPKQSTPQRAAPPSTLVAATSAPARHRNDRGQFEARPLSELLDD